MAFKKYNSSSVSATATVENTAPTTPSSNTKELELKIAELETKLETLISVLKTNPKNNIEKLSKGLL